MYCHPHVVKKWAKAMKPVATPAQLEQARIMRAAKIAKRIFMQRQHDLFSLSASTRAALAGFAALKKLASVGKT